MSVLAVPLSLGEGPGRIEDAEALVRKVVRDRLTQWGARLDDWRREELVSYLLGVSWELSCRYDPEKDKNPNLAAYTARILSLRVADWYRQTFGDTRHGERPIVLSLDAPATLGRGTADESEVTDRLVDTLRASTGDPAEDRSPDLVGILNGAGRQGPRAHAAVGQPATRRAKTGDRGPAAVKAVRSKAQPRVPGTRRAPSRPPLCTHCFVTFREAYHRVNEHTPAELQLSDSAIEAKAQKRSRAVKFGDEWACPRCTKLEDAEGQELMLQSVYVSRAQRRGAVGKGKQAARRSVAAHERKALQRAQAQRANPKKKKG